MSLANDLTKSWLDSVTSGLEDYKYTTYGTVRNDGSYMLTHVKSIAGYAEKEPEMFGILANMELSKDGKILVAGIAIGSVITAVAAVQIGKHILNKSKKIEEVNNKSEEKENK